MKTILTFITDILFPPSSDELIIRPLTIEDFRTHYQPSPLEHGTALSVYAHRPISSAIHLAKFHNHPHARVLLASLLTLYIERSYQEPCILIPMPLSRKRYISRGYNQVEEVARIALTNKQHVTTRTDILIKKRTTAPQTSLKRKERLTNQADAFAVTRPLSLEVFDTPILLLDDVYTTGATMRSAYTTLTQAGYTNVSCVALAH